MAMSNADLLLMTFLDAVGGGLEIPDGCDTVALAGLGFIVDGAGGWMLTDEGTRCLEGFRLRLGAVDG